MVVKKAISRLLYGVSIGALVASAAPAFAEDAQLDKLQHQIDALQKQLQSLKHEVVESKKSGGTSQQAAQAPAPAPGTVYLPPPPSGAPMPTKAASPSWWSGIKISLAGSFIALDGVWRQHNEISSGASDPPFSTMPFPNSPLWSENELRASAQQSRLALKISGDIDPAQHLAAYWENDWLGAGVTANSRESNSYNLRMRQAWVSYDNDNWHSHFAAGQMWSLLTQNKVGMLVSTENAPLTIDAQYAVGFNWARQPGVRFVQDWNKTIWFGVSVESSQTAFASNGNGVAGAAALSAGNGTVVPPGLAVNPGNNCNAGGLLNSTTQCSNNAYPDVIEKVAIDPGWGHYEAFALQRWFTDEVSAPGSVTDSAWHQKTNFGWGVGGSVLMPVIAKYLDVQGSVLTGQGLGRYGSSQLPDVTIGPDGTLKPLQTTQVFLGLVAHPWTGLDVYGYAGQEQVNANSWTIAGTAGGWGNPAYGNGGCLDPNLGSTFAAGFNTPIGATLCTANVQRTQEFTVGFWQNIYKGDLGRVAFGAQYEHMKLWAFPGVPGASPQGTAPGPTPNQGLNPYNNIVFLSLRYFPF